METKVKILKRLDEGVQGNRLALDFNVIKFDITFIKSKKNNLNQIPKHFLMQKTTRLLIGF